MKAWIGLMVIGALLGTGRSEARQTTGRIGGQVLDAETQEPLIGTNLLLQPGGRGTMTDAEGRFLFDDVAVGTYTLRASYVGYEPLVETDLIVRSQRLTQVTLALAPTVLEGEEVVVTGGFFEDVAGEAASVTTFGAEEIRRAPGAAGDVSRIISGLPSIAKIDDTKNSLVVRGGSPIENSFYVDQIEIPNINHFPTQGSSGGPIGLLNVDLIDDVRFYAGGFSAAYGDRLSAVMDLSFREGNRDEVDVQLDLNLSGAGFVGEGPLGGGQGSWLVSARRSYLDLLVNTFFSDVPVVPTYSDVQAKLVYDVNPRHRLTALTIASLDESGFDREGAQEVEENIYGPANYAAATTGATWRYLWKADGFSTTALSHSVTRYRVHYFETQTEAEVLDNQSTEHVLRGRTVNFYRLGPAHRIEFGADVKVQVGLYDQTYGASVDPLGQPSASLHLDGGFTATQVGGFVTYRWQPSSRFTVLPGVRVEHYTYTGRTHVAPRLAATYALTGRTSLHAAAGLYVQSLPLVLLAQHAAHRELRETKAVHVVLGFHHFLTETTRLTLEAYYKAYRHLPLDPQQPALFVIDELFYDNGFFQHHARLVDAGQAVTRGVEGIVQKKLARRLYGIVSGAYFRSRYRDAAGIWRDRLFDNRYLFTLEGGFKPSARHEASLRWVYAGGAPYTPFDEAASEAAGHGIFDAGRVNAERLPAYHSLNLRYDRRFHFKRSTLIAYLSVWNIYGRRNLAAYTWNEITNEPKRVEQWGTLPIFGLEFEF